MGIPYNYKLTLDFLVMLFWDPGGPFCYKKVGTLREKRDPCFRAKAGIDAGQLFHSIVLGRLLVL